MFEDNCMFEDGASSSAVVVCDVFETGAYDDVFINNLIKANYDGNSSHLNLISINHMEGLRYIYISLE